MFEGFPYTNFHDLNLDWIIQKVKEAYSPDNPPENVVLSVNGETGDVILYKDAIVRLPDTEESMWNIHRVADNSSEGIQFEKGQPAKRIAGTNRYVIYDAGNPPPYPVQSVNGQTGNVLINIPVQSVNGETGAVVLYRNAQITFPNVDATTWNMYRGTGDNGTITGIQFETGNKAKRIDGTNRYGIYDEGNPPPYPVTSVGTLTGAVAILDTTIVTDGNTQKLKITFPVTTVDGQTGTVRTWGYSSNRDIEVPLATEGDAWGLIRDIPSGTIGIDFEYDNNEFAGYITFKADGSSTTQRLKILTPTDIPSSSGVVSINGLNGVVVLTAADIALSSLDSTKIDTLISANASAISAVGDMVADTYNPSTTYYKGAMCKKDGVLYKATAQTTGTWDSTKWSATDLAEQVVDKVDETVITATPEFTSFATENYNKGDYILISGVLHKAKVNISELDTFSSSNVEQVTVGSELTSLNEQIGTLNDNITDIKTRSAVSITAGTNVTIVTQNCISYPALRLLFINCMITVGTGGLSGSATVIKLPTGYTLSARHDFQIGSALIYGGASGSEFKIASGTIEAGNYDIVIPVAVTIS